MRLSWIGTGSLWLMAGACGPAVGPTASGGSGDSSSGVATGTAASETVGGETAPPQDETGVVPPPAQSCELSDLPEPPVPPGSNCTPGRPQPGGMCHEVVEVPLREALVTHADLFDVNGDGLDDITMSGSEWAATAISSPMAWPQVHAYSWLQPYQGPTAAADIDGDSIADLIVGRSPLSIFHGDGEGGFTGRLGGPTPGSMVAMAAADIDGDGLDDVLRLHVDGRISSLRNRGGGRLATQWQTSAGCIEPLAFAAADFDNDGALDVVIATTTDNISLLLGDGDGGFSPGPGLTHAIGGTTIAADDIDGDGTPEIAVIAADAPRVDLLRLDVGTDALVVVGSIELSAAPSNVAIADIQGDGALDLIIGHANDGQLSWALGDESGGLVEPTSIETPATTDLLALGDINGDGFTDVVASDGIGTLSRVFGGADGFASAEIGYVVAQLIGHAVADLDGDGNAEQVSIANDRLYYSPGQAGGTLGAPEYMRLPEAHIDLETVVPANLDGDGITDFIVAGDFLTTMTLIGNADGTVGPGVSTVDGYAEHANISVADFDEDGHPDLLVNGSFDVQVWHSDGAGGLTPGAVIGGLSTSRNPLATADIDGDGHHDVLWASLADPLVSAALGDGMGGFGPVITSVVATGPGAETSGLALGDIDEDGIIDVITESGIDTIVVAYGLGDGSFAEGVSVVGESHNRPIVGDLNGDGHLDIAAYSWGDEALITRMGQGDGTFTEGASFPMDFLDIFPKAGHLNGDNRADLMLRASFGTVRLLMSNPCGCEP